MCEKCEAAAKELMDKYSVKENSPLRSLAGKDALGLLDSGVILLQSGIPFDMLIQPLENIAERCLGMRERMEKELTSDSLFHQLVLPVQLYLVDEADKRKVDFDSEEFGVQIDIEYRRMMVEEMKAQLKSLPPLGEERLPDVDILDKKKLMLN